MQLTKCHNQYREEGTRMEVIKSRRHVIDYLISLMIKLAWETKLGNRLIEKGELKLTTKNLKKIRSELEKFLYAIYTTEDTIVPMGTLLDEPSNKNKEQDDYYFLLISNDNLAITISDLKNEFSKFTGKRIISESHAKNAILYWFRDWQVNPEIIKNDLEVIRKKIQKGG